jgi:membrane-associated phospholipid phosphatase
VTSIRPPTITAVAVMAAILLAFALDQPIARIMAGADPDVLRIARLVTWFGQGGVLLYPSGILILAGLLLRLIWDDMRHWLDPVLKSLGATFITVALAGLADDALKIVFGRARPYLWLAGDNSGFGFFRYGARFASFPSGHTTTSFAAAVVLAVLAPRWRRGFPVAALAIALSRIVLDVHYLSDVIAGGALGICIATISVRFFRKYNWLPAQDPSVIYVTAIGRKK